jgi:hypothetical protein
MTAPITSLPGVLDALFVHAQAVVEAETPPAGTEPAGAFDGPASKNVPQTYLVIGYAGGGPNPQAPVASSSALTDLSLQQERETYAVVCHASTFVGNADATFKSLRDRLYSLLAALEARLVADRRLGGACMRARVEVIDYVPSISPKGPTVVVPFHVQIEAMRGATR